MFRTGVVVGKFYPPHRGHQYLIETARSQAEQLTVIVCDRPWQSIRGSLRAAWLREIYPDVSVLCIDDIYPDDDSELWARLTISWLGYAPEAVFTSEDYGDRYAFFMGATHIRVDQARLHVPVSGTQVRADPLAWWDYLAPCVRAHYVVRVCLVGAESTGKTTLAEALATHYHTVWVPEYGREFTEIKVRGPEPDSWYSEEFVTIAAEQSRLEDLAARAANRVLICDTDAFATAIWHERYMRSQSAEVEAIAAPRRYALYLLTDVHTPFVQDGIRDGEQIREWMHQRFQEALIERGQAFAILSGTHQERMDAAIRLINPLLSANVSGTSRPVQD